MNSCPNFKRFTFLKAFTIYLVYCHLGIQVVETHHLPGKDLVTFYCGVGLNQEKRTFPKNMKQVMLKNKITIYFSNEQDNRS